MLRRPRIVDAGAGPHDGCSARARTTAALLALTAVLLGGCDARRRDDIRAWLDPSAVPALAQTKGAAAHGDRSVVTASMLAPKGAYRLTVSNVRVCPERPSAKVDPAFEIWGAEVELEALTVDDLPVNPFYARLVDSNGSAYPSVVGGCEPRLAGAPLARRARAQGWLDFRVPRARSGFKLVYAPRVGASPRATEVQVPLGR